MEIREIMQRDRWTCPADADLARVIDALRLAPEGRLAVVSAPPSQCFVAELCVRDVAAALARDARGDGQAAATQRARDLARPAAVCRLDDTPEAALAVMHAHAASRLYVVDEQGRYRGLVTYEQAYQHSDAIARSENGRRPAAGGASAS